MSVVSKFSDEEFLAAWITSGYNAKEAYKSFCPSVTNDSMKTLGARRLTKCKSSDIYKSLLAKAYEIMNKSMDSKDEKLAHQAAKDIVDRHNGKAKDTVKVEGELKFTVVNYANTTQLQS